MEQVRSEGEGMFRRRRHQGAFVGVLSHLVSICCFIGSEEMALPPRVASASFSLALFPKCCASEMLVFLSSSHMFWTLANPRNRRVRSNIWLKAGWEFLSKGY